MLSATQPEYQTPHYNQYLHQISPRCLNYCTTGHRGQLNTHYHQTTYPSSPQSHMTWVQTTTKAKDFHQLQESLLVTIHGIPLWLRTPYLPTYTLPLFFQTSCWLQTSTPYQRVRCGSSFCLLVCVCVIDLNDWFALIIIELWCLVCNSKLHRS